MRTVYPAIDMKTTSSLQMLWNTVLCQIATSKPPTETTERAGEVLREGTNVVPE